MTRRCLAAWTLLLALIVSPGASQACARDAGGGGGEYGVEARSRKLLAVWQQRFDIEKLGYVVAGPFVIAGDGGAVRLADYRDGTVLAAHRALKATYFRTDLTEPVLILLFETEEPYRRLAAEWFDARDVPHYGLFRRNDRVMLMNVGTGTGTLVHELVHALLAADFRRAPDWFNEGLASLYEQCSIDGERIRGHVNWRLPALQRAIEDRTLRPLEELVEDDDFYEEASAGLNYAQARYLLLYLQERGLLHDYYARFREGVEDDPNGLETLKQVLAPRDLEAFDAEWRRWVMTLNFE